MAEGDHRPLRTIAGPVTRIGLSGTGWLARRVFRVLAHQPDFAVTGVLTRRPLAHSAGTFPEEVLTGSTDRLIENCDIVVECSGKTVEIADLLVRAGAAGRKIVTMNAEAQVTIGSALLRRGVYLTDGHGDQPGAFATLAQEAVEMGFEPQAFINLKGFFDPNPGPEQMAYWAAKLNHTLQAVTNYTDGSKLNLEQALTANFFGARILRQGMFGGSAGGFSELGHFGERALALDAPVSDYVVYPGARGVVLLATHPLLEADADMVTLFPALQIDDGRLWVLHRPYNLIHLEIMRTLRGAVRGLPPLINNGTHPTATVVGVAKRPLSTGTLIEHGLGGFDLRGEAVEIEGHEDAVPITLLDGARLTRPLEAGEMIRKADVELPETLAYGLYAEALEGCREPVPKPV